ncbi:MAG: DUF58 domain-containing protein [Candidatus Brocadiales bacterium]
MTERQVKRKIQLYFRRLASSLFEGAFPSSVSGPRGLELDEIREYQPGDSLRSIDWKTTARSRKLHIRVSLPERRTSVLFLIDKSGSKRFGASKALKEDALFSALSTLFEAVGETGNPIGLVTFTDRIERYFPPYMNERQALKLIDILKRDEPQGTLTDLDVAFFYVNSLNLPPSVIFILSDFIAEDNYYASLSTLSKRHEVIPIVVKDEREDELPRARAFLTVRDMESLEMGLLDLSRPLTGERYLEHFIRLGLDYIVVKTGENEGILRDKFADFFEKRARTRRAVRR